MEIALHSSKVAPEFYLMPIALLSASESKPPESTATTKQRSTATGRKPNSQERAGNTLKGLSEEELRILRIWLNQLEPFDVQTEMFLKAGIASGSKQTKIKNKFIRFGIVNQHWIQTQKTHLSILEPRDEAYAAIGQTKPRWASKGKYVHSFIAHRVARWAKSNGMGASIEQPLSNDRAIDVLLTNNDSRAFVEIVVSEPLAKEKTNLEKCMEDLVGFTHLLFLTTDSKARNKMVDLLNSCHVPRDIRRKIECLLAGEFVRGESKELKKLFHLNNDGNSTKPGKAQLSINQGFMPMDDDVGGK